ncbi:MAG: cyclic nucleotide-binding domain-containing protein [Anaerosomatales bacterium]|nr:cyclic nucleotide-binding domain-containing protein [Anaerosomatales bacterium]
MISGVSKRYGDGDVIFKQGSFAGQMYVVRRGKVRIFRDQDGKETTLAALGPGEFFGEMSVIEGKPRSATAQAVGETELEVIEADELRRVAGDDIVWQMLKRMSSRIRETDEALEQLSVQDIVRREHLSSLPIRRNPYL